MDTPDKNNTKQTNFCGFVTVFWRKGLAPAFEYAKENPPPFQVTGNHMERGYRWRFIWNEDGSFESDWGEGEPTSPAVAKE